MRAYGRAGPPEVVQEALADLKIIGTKDPNSKYRKKSRREKRQEHVEVKDPDKTQIRCRQFYIELDIMPIRTFFNCKIMPKLTAAI